MNVLTAEKDSDVKITSILTGKIFHPSFTQLSHSLSIRAIGLNSFFSKSQHGEEAFPPGVPAPRLSIVAATQALPNVIGNAQRQQAAGNVSNVLGNALTNGFGLGNGLGNGVNLLNGFGRDDKNSNPGSPAKKAKIEETDEDDRLVIEEYW